MRPVQSAPQQGGGAKEEAKLELAYTVLLEPTLTPNMLCSLRSVCMRELRGILPRATGWRDKRDMPSHQAPYSNHISG